MADLMSSGLWNIVTFQSPPKFGCRRQPTSPRDAIASATLSDTFFEIHMISRQARRADQGFDAPRRGTCEDRATSAVSIEPRATAMSILTPGLFCG